MKNLDGGGNSFRRKSTASDKTDGFWVPFVDFEAEMAHFQMSPVRASTRVGTNDELAALVLRLVNAGLLNKNLLVTYLL